MVSHEIALDFKKHQCQEHNLHLKLAQKKRIQDEFWEKLHLHVDMPLNGVGNCNTGWVFHTVDFSIIQFFREINF